MGKKKGRLSVFSTIVQQINEPSNEYHLIDNEYFAAFNSLEDIEQFHTKLTEKQQTMKSDEDAEFEQDHDEMDMKSFAQQYLVDLPENLHLPRTSSRELFTTEQPINWSPTVKESQNITLSPGTFFDQPCQRLLFFVLDNKKRKSTTPIKFNIETNSKRQRRNIRDLPQSSEFIFPSDHHHRKTLNVRLFFLLEALTFSFDSFSHQQIYPSV